MTPHRALLLATYATFERIATPEQRAERDALLGNTTRKGRATAVVLAARDRLGTVRDRVLAAELGVSLPTVTTARESLGIPAYRVPKRTTARQMAPAMVPWLARVHDRLGLVPDAVLAREAGVSRERVGQVRDKLGIPPLPPGPTPVQTSTWLTDEVRAMLGTVPDSEVARKTGPTVSLIARTRKQLGISAATPHGSILDAWAYLFGTIPDSAIARVAGVSTPCVSVYRVRHPDLPPSPTGRGKRWADAGERVGA